MNCNTEAVSDKIISKIIGTIQLMYLITVALLEQVSLKMKTTVCTFLLFSCNQIDFLYVSTENHSG